MLVMIYKVTTFRSMELKDMEDFIMSVISLVLRQTSFLWSCDEFITLFSILGLICKDIVDINNFLVCVITKNFKR